MVATQILKVMFGGLLGVFFVVFVLNTYENSRSDMPGDGIQEAETIISRFSQYDRVVLCRFYHAGERFEGHQSADLPQIATVGHWDCNNEPICLPKHVDRNQLLASRRPNWEVGRGGRSFIGFEPIEEVTELNSELLDRHCRPRSRSEQ